MTVANGEGAKPNEAPGPAGWSGWVRLLIGAERAIFSFVGALFFIAAFALAVRAAAELWALIAGPQAEIISAGTSFLDVMLLVLMMVELAYTVIVSLRGSVLAPEPFLIVGLIAVIRRMLVITIGNVNQAGAPAAATGNGLISAGSQPTELGILTAVVVALVLSIVLLRRHPRTPDEFAFNQA